METPMTPSGRPTRSRLSPRATRETELSPVRLRVREAQERARILAELEVLLREEALFMPPPTAGPGEREA